MEDLSLEKMPLSDSRPTSWLLSTSKTILKGVVELARPAILTRSTRTQKLRRTSYLDGLKGFAAFLVYWMHNTFHTHSLAIRVFESGWGWDGRFHFVTFPFIRTFFIGGHLSVATFYVISGYVLTTKPMTLLQAGKFTELGDNLASALFRRWARLYIPVALTTLIYITIWHAFDVPTTYPPHKATYAEELWGWYKNFKSYSFIFKNEPVPWMDYNQHTWSIPTEFLGSIVVFTACLTFSRCTNNMRLLLEIGLFLYFYIIVNGWYASAFMSGMILGDLDLLAMKDELPFKSTFASLRRHKTAIAYLGFMVALWLGGCPSHDEDIEHFRESPGWYYISFLKPKVVKDPKWAFLLWASTFLVASIPHIFWLKAFFESRFCQYLGRICFALYLVHGPVIWTVGERAYAMFGIATPWDFENIPYWVNWIQVPEVGVLGFNLPFLIPQLFIVLPFTLWVAEVATKLIDEPSVKFMNWLYRKTLNPELHEK